MGRRIVSDFDDPLNHRCYEHLKMGVEGKGYEIYHSSMGYPFLPFPIGIPYSLEVTFGLDEEESKHIPELLHSFGVHVHELAMNYVNEDEYVSTGRNCGFKLGHTGMDR